MGTSSQVVSAETLGRLLSPQLSDTLVPVWQPRSGGGSQALLASSSAHCMDGFQVLFSDSSFLWLVIFLPGLVSSGEETYLEPGFPFCPAACTI